MNFGGVLFSFSKMSQGQSERSETAAVALEVAGPGEPKCGRTKLI